eukprot:2792305-Amphidinium_carterae.1
MKPRAQQDSKCPNAKCKIKHGDESMVNMAAHNSSQLPTWSHKVMYSPWLPSSLALKKILKMRNPMVYQYVNHKMLCASTYFMRNSNNWTREVDTPPIILKDGSCKSQEDLRFRLEVEPVYLRHDNDGVPPGTISHHY